MDTRILSISEEDILIAGQILRNGGLVAFPTETVYGLGANALDDEAVKKVYTAKGRPSDNPMIVHISEIDDLNSLAATITDDMKVLANTFWPGPMTMIVKARPIVSRVATGGLDTVGVRLPSNPIARRMIQAAGIPIAAPSANLSGKPSPTTFRHTAEDMDGRVDAIIEGDDSEVGIESTVIDVTGEVPMILRPGIITKEDFERVLKKEVLLDPTLLEKPTLIKGKGLLITADDFKPRSPGMKYKHYAPNAEMIIYKGEKAKVMQAISEEKARREANGLKVEVIIFEDSKSKAAAHDLFARLRECDRAGADVILATALTETGVGFSVMNRMLKSAGYNVVIV